MQKINFPVAFFDSGIGGLTAVFRFLKFLPCEKILYFADTAYMPYGEKKTSEILNRLDLFFSFIKRFDPKLIVIACGTASSVLIKEGVSLSSNVYSIPIVDVINPSCMGMLKSTKNNTVGIIATAVTVHLNIYEKILNKLNPSLRIFSKPCAKLASFIEEENQFNLESNLNNILHEYLDDFKGKNIDTLLLGCTHYSIIKEQISAYVGNKIKIVGASEETAEYAVTFLKKQKLLNTEQTTAKMKIFVTGNPDSFYKSLKTLFGDTAAARVDITTVNPVKSLLLCPKIFVPTLNVGCNAE